MTKKPSVLVTGINGFVGSHLAHALLSQKMDVHGITRNAKNTRYLDQLKITKKVTLHQGDLKERSTTENVFNKHAFETVYHLAAQADVWKSATGTETQDTNVTGTINLLDGIQKSQCNPTVIISSTVRVIPLLQRSPTIVTTPYDLSKQQIEQISQLHFKKGMKGAIARDSNVYGPNDWNFNRLIPRIMKGILVDKHVKLIKNGQARRDYLYVQDAVDGYLALNEHVNNPAVQGNSFTFATGERYTPLEVLGKVEQILNEKAEIEWDDTPLVDIDQVPLDITRTISQLSWKPATPIEKGLRETISWYEKNIGAMHK